VIAQTLLDGERPPSMKEMDTRSRLIRKIEGEIPPEVLKVLDREFASTYNNLLRTDEKNPYWFEKDNGNKGNK